MVLTMPPRSSGGIRDFLDTGTDFLRLGSALWTFVRRWPDGPDPLKPAEYVPASGISRMSGRRAARILES